MANLLRRAGIDVAILGPSEMCTGDSARRSGNEYLFQMLAQPNVEMLNGMGVKKIITQCPHCFNTLLNEYPQVGGNYEVIHHTQLLEQLIDSGQLDVVAGNARRADHVPRLVLPRPPQRRLRRAAQGRRLDQGRRSRRDAAQRHEGHVLRRRWRPDVDGGDDRHEGQRRARGRGAVDRCVTRRHGLPVLLHHAGRRREGCRGGGRRGQGRRHLDPPASTRSSRAKPTFHAGERPAASTPRTASPVAGA